MKSTQSGFSLMEVILSQTIGLFLMIGLIHIYLLIEKTFHMQESIEQIQENGRFAVHFLREHILMAGHVNCDSSTSFLNTDFSIQGYQEKLPTFLKGKVLKDTDSFVISHCAYKSNSLSNGTVFFEKIAFFVGETNRKNKFQKTIYALYKMPIGGSKRELVSGVSDMKIYYGVSTEDSKNVLKYFTADSVIDWKKVKAVSISLLLNSEFPVLQKPETYSFYGKTFLGDRFLHREWHLYVALRNFI